MAVTADACPKYPAGPILTFRNRPIAISTACEGSANSAGAPVDLAPPGEDAREVRHHGCDRHDRHGLLRPVLIDNTGINMIDESVPTMPEMVPAMRPTMMTKRKLEGYEPLRSC